MMTDAIIMHMHMHVLRSLTGAAKADSGADFRPSPSSRPREGFWNTGYQIIAVHDRM
jgi:hypothetical protein